MTNTSASRALNSGRPGESDQEATVLRIPPRRVRFDLDDAPPHWMFDNAFLTHTANSMHVILPPGEDWFVRICRDALPHVTDPQLRRDVRGFMGQEAIHSRAHTSAMGYFDQIGVDAATPTRRFTSFLGAVDAFAHRFGEKRSLRMRLEMMAAVEHFTSTLSELVYRRRLFDDTHDGMADLLYWHTAEELEHRDVAFDLLDHVYGAGWWARFRGLVSVTTPLVIWWAYVRRALLRSDPNLRDDRDRRAEIRASNEVFTIREAWRLGFGYLRRGYHPSQGEVFPEAVAYLDESPGVLAGRDSGQRAPRRESPAAM